MSFAAMIAASRILLFTSLVIAALLVSVPAAFAQSAQSASAGAGGAKPPPKKTTVNFEDQLIEGQTQKPELFYLLQQRDPNFKRLIKLRENFLPEMRDTAEDMNRAGSGH